MEYLPHIEIETGDNPVASVIWLHGLGADGNDFAPIVPELKLPDNKPVRFIFPHAPEMPVTINGGYVMPAWYDILEMDIDRKVDEAQLQRSAGWIRDLIAREIERGIDSQRIFIFGFSQGGAVAYECALSYDKPLGGLVALSTYFATADSIVTDAINRKIPLQIHHGTYDPVVNIALGEAACQRLNDYGYEPAFYRWPIEHNVCLEEVDVISKWLQQQLDS